MRAGATGRRPGGSKLPHCAVTDDGHVTSAGHDPPLSLHPDRLFPPEPGVRAIARDLYEAIAGAAADLPARARRSAPALLRRAVRRPGEPARHLGSLRDAAAPRRAAIPLDELGVGDEPLSEERAREDLAAAVRELGRLPRHRGALLAREPARRAVRCHRRARRCRRPMRSTTRSSTCLGEDAFRPRALYARFGVEVLATTDDPCDDLAAHVALADDPSWPGRVIPTFRPDRFLEPGQPGWAGAIAELAEASGIDTGDYAGYIAALEQRRRYFIAHGATAADHSHADARTDPLDPADASADLPRCARRRGDGGRGGRLPAAHGARDGADVVRGRARDDAASRASSVATTGRRPTRFGPDTGHDIPVALELTNALRPLLERFGTHAGLPPRRLHGRRDAVVARARAAGGLLSVGVRRRAVVVPRRAGRDQAVPGRDRRDRRVLAHRRLRRRHARVLHDPGAARHVAAHRRRRARAARGRAPAGRSTRRSRPPSTS